MDHASAPRLTVLSGPSGVGKDAVIEVIRKQAPWVWISVSVTTRRKRDYEIEGEHYHFATRKEFERYVEEGAFLEWAEFAGNLYGTPRGPVEAKIDAKVPTLLKIDLQGARQVREAMAEARLVFLAPPSREELHRRLTGRGTEDPETLRRRLEHADEELGAEGEFDVTVVNDHLERAAHELIGLLGSSVLTAARHHT